MASSSTCPGSSSVSLTVLADSPHQPKSMIFLDVVFDLDSL